MKLSAEGALNQDLQFDKLLEGHHGAYYMAAERDGVDDYEDETPGDERQH